MSNFRLPKAGIPIKKVLEPYWLDPPIPSSIQYILYIYIYKSTRSKFLERLGAEFLPPMYEAQWAREKVLGWIWYTLCCCWRLRSHMDEHFSKSFPSGLLCSPDNRITAQHSFSPQKLSILLHHLLLSMNGIVVGCKGFSWISQQWPQFHNIVIETAECRCPCCSATSRMLSPLGCGPESYTRSHHDIPPNIC